ncbi:MAG: class I SAM-dependent rRNA methyltransferase [Bryobacterales bacterium]|nr:class I SAM-dependent rRNA methyltransferase [Bryobacterales bacterium]
MWPLPQVKVSRKGALRVDSGHPWIFSSDVAARDTGVTPGSSVRVVAPGGRSLGTAHYSTESQITLRMLSPRVEPIDESFFERLLRQAIGYRRSIVSNSNAYRVVSSEADGLPGLVVDRYAGSLSVQLLTQGMDRQQGVILALLARLLEPEAIVLRNDAPVRRKEGLPLLKSVVSGTAAPAEIEMNGLKLRVDLLGGQKTGAFLDQRENYRVAESLVRGTALDCFTSTGGFALHMARRAEHVEAVDSSSDALECALANARANSLDNIEFRHADAFELLASYASGGRRYSAVVLDPPAFAKSRSSITGALRGYKEINLRAMRLLAPDGLLITCSCSHHVSEADLLEVVASAALDAGRKVRIRERRTQAPDHPILLTVPETMYLKCLILEMIPPSEG